MDVFQTYAAMVLCARDVDVIWHDIADGSGGDPGGNPKLPPAGAAGYAYVTAAAWRALAQLRCDDLFICKQRNCYYGLFLRCEAAVGPFQPGDHLVAIRGTMDTQEWINDGLAIIPRAIPGVNGLVGAGFWDVYASMTVADLGGGAISATPARTLAQMVVAAAPSGGKLYVVGHSLGAALATYLTYDLQVACAGSAITLAPFFFASPHPGTTDYALCYRGEVDTYSVVNFARDIVPTLPPGLLGFTALQAGGPTHDVHVIAGNDPNAPPFDLANNHSPVAYARMLDPANPIAQALPIP